MRSPKSGSDWEPNDLLAYNIVIQFQDATTFFGVNPLPQPAVANEVLTQHNADDMTNDSNYKFMNYMDLAMNPVPMEESAVVDFAVCLLSLLDYAPRTRITRTWADITFTICGERRHAKTDVCVVDKDDIILLLVQENKRHKEQKDPSHSL